MTLFDETKSILENLYFLSGPLVLIVAIFGLKQIKIAKDSLRINSKRQSAILAFDLSQKYMETIQTDYENLTDQMSELGIDYTKLEELNLPNLKLIDKKNKNYSEFEKAKKYCEDLEFAYSQILNKLEAYSVPFNNKIADEEIAYNLDVLQYISLCNLCAAGIVSYREKDGEGTLIYKDIIELYDIWKNRNEEQIIESQVSSLIIKKNLLKIKKIKPLGTE